MRYLYRSGHLSPSDAVMIYEYIYVLSKLSLCGVVSCTGSSWTGMRREVLVSG